MSNIISQRGLSKPTTSVTYDADIVWSSAQAWNGLVVEKHLLAGKDVSQIKAREDTLVIKLSSACTEKNKKTDCVERLSNICFWAAPCAASRPCVHRGSQQREEMLLLMLSPEMMSHTARELRVDLKNSLIERHLLRDAQVEHIGIALESEAESGYISGRLYGESLGTALAVHLLSKYSLEKPEINSYKGGMTPNNLRRVIEYISDNLTEDIALSSLAKVANLSQFRFAHNFKQATGLSPHQYVIHERLERAKKMLRETDLTVTTIAYAVGCGSPSRFTLLFRRANGVIPSAYRSSFR